MVNRLTSSFGFFPSFSSDLSIPVVLFTSNNYMNAIKGDHGPGAINVHIVVVCMLFSFAYTGSGVVNVLFIYIHGQFP